MSILARFMSSATKILCGVPEDVMMGWAENPNTLEQALIDALLPANSESDSASILKRVIGGGTTEVAGILRFVVNEDSLRDANVGWTSHWFNEYCLGKTEEEVYDAVLSFDRLAKRSSGLQILNHLGSGCKEISLAHFLNLIKRQSRGEKGLLFVDGCPANIAFIRDKEGVLRIVNARWYSENGFWRIFVESVDDSLGWFPGSRVISCIF